MLRLLAPFLFALGACALVSCSLEVSGSASIDVTSDTGYSVLDLNGTTIVVEDLALSVDGVSYGAVAVGDEVSMESGSDGVRVLVNGVERTASSTDE